MNFIKKHAKTFFNDVKNHSTEYVIIAWWVAVTAYLIFVGETLKTQ